MVTVELPAALRGFAGQQAKVKVEAITLGAALESLCVLHPALRGKLFTEAGALKRTIGVFVGDDDVRDDAGLVLRSSDVVVLVAAMAGG